MPEITDEMIKKKHKEFDQRIRSVLNELRGKSTNGQSDFISKIKDAARFLKGRST